MTDAEQPTAKDLPIRDQAPPKPHSDAEPDLPQAKADLPAETDATQSEKGESQEQPASNQNSDSNE